MKDNILQFLYQGKTVTEIIRLFTSSLRLAPADFGNLTEANLMDHYQNIVENTAFCNEVQKLITSIYYELAKIISLKSLAVKSRWFLQPTKLHYKFIDREPSLTMQQN